MPYRPQRPCRAPGCPNLTDAGYCLAHQPAANRQKNSRRSSGVRYRVDQRDGRRCVVCGSPVGVEKHHLIPLHAGGLDIEANVVTLCAVHHRQAHERRGPGEKFGP